MHVPSWFLSRLKDADPQLVVYFNPFKQRWMIDRQLPGKVNTNVMVVQAENGDFMELSDNTIDRLLSMDSWKKHGSYEAFHRHNVQLEVEAKAKIDAEIRENYRLAALDDKIQLHRAYDLIQRHDTARVNQ